LKGASRVEGLVTELPALGRHSSCKALESVHEISRRAIEFHVAVALQQGRLYMASDFPEYEMLFGIQNSKPLLRTLRRSDAVSLDDRRSRCETLERDLKNKLGHSGVFRNSVSTPATHGHLELVIGSGRPFSKGDLAKRTAFFPGVRKDPGEIRRKNVSVTFTYWS